MLEGSLTILDVSIILIYFFFIVWFGTRFGKKQTDTRRYFLGSRNLPMWAVGISMFATIISSWTFIALPGKAFKDDLHYLMTICTLLISAAITSQFLIPLYREKIKLSAYEYLEKRFGIAARVYGNLAFTIVHFGKMGAILYLLSLAIAGITGWNIFILIAIIGVSTIVYTFFGGIEGVVWADAIQGILLLGAGLVSLIFMFSTTPGGIENLVSTTIDAGKFKLLSFEFYWSDAGLYAVIFFGFNYFLQKYVSDQTVVQRFLLSPSKKQASQALWLSSILVMFSWVLFMSIGALLWGYYNLQPDLLPSALRSQPDKVFPYFIGHQLPQGVTGIILAGLMAATMSTLSSDLNSLSVVVFDDYYNKIKKDRSEEQRLFFSRLTVLVSGLLAVILGMAMTQIHSMADAAFNFVSLVAGGVLGMYFLGIFTKRCSPKGLYIGLVSGVLFIFWVYLGNNDSVSWIHSIGINTLWAGLFGNVIVFGVGIMASVLITPDYRTNTSLTVFQEGKLS